MDTKKVKSILTLIFTVLSLGAILILSPMLLILLIAIFYIAFLPFIVAPLESLFIFFTVFGILYLLIKKKADTGRSVVILLIIISFATTYLFSYWIMGESINSSILYEVPVEITFNPSDEAFESFYTRSGLYTEWRWSDDEDNFGGSLNIPVNYGTHGISRGSSSEVPYREPYTTTLKVRYSNNYVGYMIYQRSLEDEHITISGYKAPKFLKIPVRKGERNLTIVDSNGFTWDLEVKTLDEDANFVKHDHPFKIL